MKQYLGIWTMIPIAAVAASCSRGTEVPNPLTDPGTAHGPGIKPSLRIFRGAKASGLVLEHLPSHRRCGLPGHVESVHEQRLQPLYRRFRLPSSLGEGVQLDKLAIFMPWGDWRRLSVRDHPPHQRLLLLRNWLRTH